MSKLIKRLIIFAVIFILVVVGYSIFFKKDATVGDLVTEGAFDAGGGDTQLVGDEFIGLLTDVQSIKLDGGIFTSSPFATLEDFSITLVQLGNEGRPNPFAPIGTDVSSTTITETPDVITNPATNITTTTTLVNGALAVGVTATERWFEWGLTESLGIQTTKLLGSASPFSQTLSGLTPNTVYYVKAVAKINGQTVYGTLQSLKTAGAVN